MVFQIKGNFQHYDWGGRNFLPNLFQLKNEQLKPYAEYWLGAHPHLSSTLIHLQNEKNNSLHEFIKTNPKSTLSEKTFNAFGELPFLCKIMDVNQMLSIQAHPNKEQALEGFEKENNQTNAQDFKNRFYKDANYKHEIIIAWSDFWLLYGIREPKEILATFQQLESCKEIFELVKEHNPIDAIKKLLFFSEEQKEIICTHLKNELTQRKTTENWNEDSYDFWIMNAFEQFSSSSINQQFGVLLIYFMNLLKLKKDSLIYMPSSTIHAYLKGRGFEVISNSDNVVRLALTNKKIDEEEFFKIGDFNPITQERISVFNLQENTIFKPPIQDFKIEVINLKPQQSISFECKGAELIFCKEGAGNFRFEENKKFKKTDSFFITSNSKLTITSEITSTLYRISDNL